MQDRHRSGARDRMFPAAFALLLVPLVAMAKADSREETGPATETIQITEQDASGKVGWRVFVDPETGELRTTPTAGQQQILDLTQPLVFGRAPGAEPEPFPLRDGGLGLEVGDIIRSYSVLQRHGDGSLTITCTHGPSSPNHHHHPVASTEEDPQTALYPVSER